MYEYTAKVIKVVDGDTIDVEVDLGFDITLKLRLRLLGIDAPERYTTEGKTVTKRVEELLPVGTVVRIVTVKDRKEKYGRYLAEVFLTSGPYEGKSINQILLEEHLVTPL